jgi:DNA polymerase III delta prime subunit
MKFYETHFEDYISAVEKHNFHPELKDWIQKFPNNLVQLPNLIFYGPSGVGKYSQMLYFLRRYSPSQLKYEKKIEFETDKLTYHYRISDIHYEIDMLLLGCNSKQLWHELFTQIVDIVSTNIHPSYNNTGVIVCKNFHSIHTELLETFYSYMQHYKNNIMSHITLRFILITESVSFIPNNILESSQIISFARPAKSDYLVLSTAPAKSIMNEVDTCNIINSKEIKTMDMLTSVDELPTDTFDNVCQPIIEELESGGAFQFITFREKLYDIMIYNVDAVECIWYILSYFIGKRALSRHDIATWMQKLNVFLKQYNNNYRPIYHLESIFLAMFICIPKN